MLVSLVVALALSAPVTDSTPAAAPTPSPATPPEVVPPAPPSVPPPPPSLRTAPPVAPVVATHAEAPPASPPPRTPFPPAHSFHLALGLGVATASGNASEHQAMSGLTAEQYGVQIEIGARFAQRFYLDGYAELGAGDTGSALGDCKSCSATRVALGLEAKYAFGPSGRFNPWIGIGGGIEAMSLDLAYETPSTAKTTYTLVRYRGWELPRLSAGVDWRINRIIGAGLFASFSFVRYDEVSSMFGTNSISGEHTWFTVGARGILFP